MTAIVVTLMVLLLIEAPAVHFILGAVMDEGLAKVVVRGLLLFSSIYLGIWLIGDFRILRETPGLVIGEDDLTVELGLLTAGDRGRGRTDEVHSHQPAARSQLPRRAA